MRDHPAAALTAAVTQELDAAGRIPVTGLSGAGLDSVIEQTFTVISRLTVHLTAAVEQAEAVDRPAELAAPSLVTWLRGRFGLTPRDASRLVRDMKSLRAAPVAADAALLGAIAVQAAAAIGHAIDDLPAAVGPEVRAAGSLSITDDHDGGIRLRGLLTAEAGAVLRAALDPLTAPRTATPAPDAANRATVNRYTVDGTTAEGAATDTAAAATESADAAAAAGIDDRTFGQRLADALVEVAERALASGELPDSGGQRPQLLITIDHDQLTTGVGAGTLPDGTEVSPAAVRRVACDAGLIPAVLGSDGQVLDLARAARTATPAQRKALAVRDRGCAFPGCDRPPEDGTRPFFVPPPWIDPQRRPRRNHQHHVRNLLRRPPAD